MTSKRKLYVWQTIVIVLGTILLVVNVIYYSGNRPINVYISGLNKQAEREVIIALVDSEFGDLDGIVKKNIWNNTKEKALNNIDDDKNGFVDDMMGWNFVENSNIFNAADHSHGECILNFLIGSNRKYQGILKGVDSCKLMLIQILKDEVGKTDLLIAGIQYAEDNGADICSLSLETYQRSEELRNVIENSGMLFVVAAGNDGEDLNDNFPSYPTVYSLKNVLSVTAIDEANKLLPESNYGTSFVDIAAYGKNIEVIFPDGENEKISGTSIAAPYVTAISAVIYAYSTRKLSATELKKHIMLSAKKHKGLTSKVRSSGYLSVQKAIENIN